MRAAARRPPRWTWPKCRKPMCIVSRSPSKRLQPVALAQELLRRVPPGQHVGLEVGQRRRRRARAHVDPDEAAALLRRVGARAHLVLEVRFGGLGRHVDAGAGRRRTSSRGRRSAGRPLRCGRRTSRRRGAGRRSVTRPTSPEVSRKAMRFSPSSRRRTRRAVGLRQLGRHQRRDPVLAHQVAHRACRGQRCVRMSLSALLSMR